MLSRSTLRLVLIVSCAHALVHIFELALPSVEMLLADDYGVGKTTTGLLSTYWRLPWGFGALGAGWLVDRVGSQRMLAVYLLGCAATCCLVGLTLPLPWLFVVMFTMGAFASIYHPAGLALISHATTLENRPRALGLHGIFGSAGIGSAPFLAALLLTLGFTWQQYYFGLAAAGLILGIVFVRRSINEDPDLHSPVTPQQQAEQDAADYGSFFTLTTLAFLQGFVYSAVLSFLPRYLAGSSAIGTELSDKTFGIYLTGGVLIAGCLGQYLAGRFARAERLERQLTWVTFANVPFLLLMSVAQDSMRLVGAVMFAIVHFMHQPLYNSLIAKYTPRHRRSLCYGFSFAMGLGLGSFGAAFNGYSRSDQMTYTTLALVATAAGLLGLALIRRTRLER
jgi:FSR family fosmidomycin resistance protein-like MFS transporter